MPRSSPRSPCPHCARASPAKGSRRRKCRPTNSPASSRARSPDGRRSRSRWRRRLRRDSSSGGGPCKSILFDMASSEGDEPMHSADSERSDSKARAVEEALGRLGEPITEAQAKSLAAMEDCDCKDGMFALAPSRRGLLAGTGLVAAAGMTAMLPRKAAAKAPPGAVEYPVPADPTKEQGRMM